MPSESTHAALVAPAPGKMLLERVPTKRPRVGEILVSPFYVGICGSDLDLLRGVRPLGTRILGHEGVGEVVDVGPGITEFSVGQRVTFLPNNPNNPADTLGVSSEGLNQQYLLVSSPAVERGMLVPFEPGIPLVCGPLLEPLATVLYGQRMLEQVCTPKRVLIVGAGPIGLFNALYAQQRGCAQVFLTDTSPARLDWAVRRGIVASSQTLLSSPQLVETLLERTAGQGMDAAYLCTPRAATRSALKQALRVVREGGAISLTAGVESPEELPEIPGVDLDGIRRANVCGLGHEVKASVTRKGKKLWLTGHSGASADYLQEAMQLMLKAPASYARVISHLVSYRAAPRMFEHLLTNNLQKTVGAPRVKVIIDFTSEGEEIEAFGPHHESWVNPAS